MGRVKTVRKFAKKCEKGVLTIVLLKAKGVLGEIIPDETPRFYLSKWRTKTAIRI